MKDKPTIKYSRCDLVLTMFEFTSVENPVKFFSVFFFFTIIFLVSIVFSPLFSSFYVTRERNRFLHRR